MIDAIEARKDADELMRLVRWAGRASIWMQSDPSGGWIVGLPEWGMLLHGQYSWIAPTLLEALREARGSGLWSEKDGWDLSLIRRV